MTILDKVRKMLGSPPVRRVRLKSNPSIVGTFVEYEVEEGREMAYVNWDNTDIKNEVNPNDIENCDE